MVKESGAGDADFGEEEVQGDMVSKERSKIRFNELKGRTKIMKEKSHKRQTLAL